jgi:DNA-binding MarR family transcriptional regulator/chemotaxis signal transduction protein
VNGSTIEQIALRLDALADSARPDAAAPLRPAERSALAAMARHGALPLKEVALAAGIAKSTASELVDGLVERGLVHRERDGIDGRRLALRLTPAGEAELAAAPLFDAQRLTAAVAGLSAADQAELERLLDLIAAGARRETHHVATAVTERASTPAAIATLPPAPSPAAAGEPLPAALSAPSGAPLRLVVCVVAGEAYAVPLATVVEVLPYTPPRHAAAAGSRRAGIISTRDGHLPVSDLGSLLGVPAPAPAPGSIVVVDGPNGREGLAVDRVAGMSTAAACSIAPPVGDAPGVSGIVEIDGALLLVLDVGALLRD